MPRDRLDRDLDRLERDRLEVRARRRMTVSDPSRRVSMADVASVAGVSGQTVSRVVNGSPHVDPDTRARVEAAMVRLGYRPHRAARALRTGRTQTIGLVVSTLATVGNSLMLQAVADAAAAGGYALTVVRLGPAEEGLQAGPAVRVDTGTATGIAASPAAGIATGIASAFAALRDQGADGAVVLNEATAIARDAPAPAGLHVVVVDSPADDRFTIVQSDHADGAATATRYLLDRGHATVAHLAGPVGSFAADERERGWRDALVSAGVAAPALVRADWTSASGFEAGPAVLATGASAVLCANDQQALGILRAAADAAIDVPRDLAVVGFDDVTDAAQFRPPLTTVRQDFDELGRRAVAALVAAIEGEAPAASSIVPTRLIVRASA